MAFEPAIDIGNTLVTLSEGSYVSESSKVFAPLTLDLGTILLDSIAFTAGSYVSEGSKVFAPLTIDLGTALLDSVAFGPPYVADPNLGVKVYGTYGALVAILSQPALDGDDTIEIVFGATLGVKLTAYAKGQIQHRLNCIAPHRGADKLVALFGNRIYVADVIFAGWTQVPALSAEAPDDDAETSIHEFGDNALLINTGGLFVVDLSGDEPFYYQLNTPIPTVKLTDVTYGSGKEHRYKYVYTASRLDSINNRLDASTTLIRETGSVKADENRIDWAEVWTDDPVGAGDTSYGILTGVALAAAYQSHTGYTAITDGQFKINVNSTAYEVTVDLSSAQSMRDVGDALQSAARYHADLATLTFTLVGTKWVVRGALGDVFTVSTGGGGTGTDLHVILGLSTGTPGTQAASATVTVGELTYPADTKDITHYTMYRGEDSADGDSSGDILGFVEDVPAARAFYAAVVEDTAKFYVELDEGQLLYRMDVGGTIKLFDGTEFTVTSLVSALRATVYTASSRYALVSAVAAKSRMAAAIGGGLVFSASQSAKVLTTSGLSLDAARDEDSLVFFADGTTEILHKVTSTITADTVNSATRAMQPATMHPVSRKFTDSVSDEKAGSLRGAWPLQTRFWEAMPAGEVSVVTPGWIITAERGSSAYAYGQLVYRWSAGYYNPAHQKYSQFWDGVQSMRAKEQYVLIRGATSVYMLQTANWSDVGDIRVGEVVAKLADPKEVSKVGGAIGRGAIQDLESGGEIVVTSEPEVRIWDGDKNSAGMSAGRVRKSLILRARPSFIAAYQSICGYFLWFRERIGDTTVQPGVLRGMAVSAFRRCLHLGLKSEQGLWWSEVSDADSDGDWVWPETQGAVCDIIDEQGQSALVVWDERTGRPFVLNPRESASNSRMAQAWEDKIDLNDPADSGVDIAGRVKFAEDYGDEKQYDIEHNESHVSLRPVKASNRGAAGYGADGLPTGFKLGAKSYVDGKATSEIEITEINTSAETIYDRPLSGRSVQHEFNTTTSAWRLMEVLSYYTAKDKARRPATGTRTTEAGYGRELAAPVVWLSRGDSLLLNRSTLATLTGAGSAAAGPDGHANSALLITTPVELANAVQAAGTLMLWSTTEYEPTGATLATYDSIVVGGVTWYLRYVTGAVAANIELPAGTVFDVRLFSTEISTAAMAHYFSAMEDDSGRQYLPR